LEYELKAEKVGRAGRAETSQASSVNIPSQEKKMLVSVKLDGFPERQVPDRAEGLQEWKTGVCELEK